MSLDDLERQLVEQAKAGQRSAGPILVSLMGDRLLGYARAIAPDLSDADREQIVELAVEAGLRAISRFDPDRGSLFGWFRTQVRFKTIDHFRAQPRNEELDPDHAGLCPEEPSRWEGPAAAAALKSAIAQLSGPDKLILALRGVEQVAYTEIALRLEITETAARQRYKRARERIRAIIVSDPLLSEMIDWTEEDR